MSDEQELKLACLHHAGGDLDHAKALFEWVSGSVRATTDSEAPEVSAPDQDKPEEPFNYRHPSKFGTDIPRRCHLEELTPEERAIRDLVGTVESLGAHPLLTTTVIQLMKAGESLADWVDIELRDKAISALQSLSSGEGGVGLLDGEPEPVPTEVRTQDEQDAAGEDSVQIESGLAANLSKSNDELLRDIGVDPETGIYTATGIDIRIGAPQEAPAIPEDWTRHDGGECPLRAGVDVDLRFRDGSTYFNSIGLGDFRKNWSWDCSEPAQIVAYRENQASAEAERIEDASQGTPSTEQTEHDRPKLTNEEFESLEKIDGVLDAEPSPILRSEVPPAAETYLAPSGDEFATVNGQTHLIVSDEAEAQGQAETAPQAAYAPIHNEDEPAAVHPDAAFWAKALPAEAEAKAQDQKFNPFRLFRQKEPA